MRFVSFLRTWKTRPNVPRPMSLRKSKSRGVRARFVDLRLPEARRGGFGGSRGDNAALDQLAAQLLEEALSPAAEVEVVALTLPSPAAPGPGHYATWHPESIAAPAADRPAAAARIRS